MDRDSGRRNAGTVLKRKAYSELEEWKSREGHKSLLLRGQRQTGKTYVVARFSETYPHSIAVNLDQDPRMAAMFEKASSVDEVVEALEISDPSFEAVPGETLIFLDEIQRCPRARSFLKYFTLDGRYDVIASGSLLGVRMEGVEDTSSLVPTGYEEHMTMHSLDFEEFLWAKGFREDVVSRVKGSIRECRELSTVALESMMDAFSEFMMVGGMPEAVSAYVSGKGIQEVRRILNGIVLTTYDDISKYSRAEEAMRIRRCLESVPYQLAETNKKFMYSRIGGGRSREGARVYGGPMLWIGGSGIGNMCHSLKGIGRPVSVLRDPDNYRVYVSDTGMLVSMMDQGRSVVMDAVRRGDTAFNQGALTENVVAECMMKAGYPLNYYIHRKDPGRMELDFVADLGSEVAAIEVKSGKSREMPSLRKTLGDGRFQRRIILERGNVRVDEDGIEHYPLFAAAFMDCMVRNDAGNTWSVP